MYGGKEKIMGKLKSTIGKFRKSKLSKSRNKNRPIRDIVTGGITALVGTAFVSQTADVISRL